MPLLRPPPSAVVARRHFSTTLRRRGGGGGSGGGAGHESHYDPPTGWFLNTPPGETAKKEGWEGIMYWGFLGSLMVAGVAYAYKPDTSIQTWALEEARRRLEIEGVVEDSTKVRKITDVVKTVSGK